MIRYSLLLFLIPILFASCSFQKRLYRDGFYVEKKAVHANGSSQPLIAEDEKSGDVSVIENEIPSGTLDDTTILPSRVETEVAQPTDTVKRKWFRKSERDTTSVEEELQAVNIETPSKRWRFAATAALVPFLGIALGFILLLFVFNEWLAIVLGGLIILTSLFYLFLSIRAHHRYKKQEGEEGKQTVWGVIGRFFLYAIALAFLAVIFNAAILWSIKDLQD